MHKQADAYTHEGWLCCCCCRRCCWAGQVPAMQSFLRWGDGECMRKREQTLHPGCPQERPVLRPHGGASRCQPGKPCQLPAVSHLLPASSIDQPLACWLQACGTHASAWSDCRTITKTNLPASLQAWLRAALPAYTCARVVLRLEAWPARLHTLTLPLLPCLLCRSSERPRTAWTPSERCWLDGHQCAQLACQLQTLCRAGVGFILWAAGTTRCDVHRLRRTLCTHDSCRFGRQRRRAAGPQLHLHINSSSALQSRECPG